MYMDPDNPDKECFANKWGLVSLANAGHEVWLICGGDMDLKQRNEYIWNNINVIELPTLFGPNNTSRLLKGFIRELKKHKDANVFNTHHYCAAVPELTALTGLFMKKPVLITYHTTFQGRNGFAGFMERFYSVLMTPFLLLFKEKIYISKHISKLFPFKFCNQKHQNIIYNQYLLPKQISKNERQEIQEKNSALFVGRITFLKGIDILITSLKGVVKDIPDFKVRLMGKYEGNFKEQMIDLATEQGVQDNIEFLGPKYGSDKWDEFARASMLIMPSRNEGFGNVVVEAMLAKLPVISSDQGALPEAGGGHSLIFNIQKPKELAGHIITLCQNEELRNKKVEEGYAYAIELTKNKILKEYETVYLKCQN